MSQTTVIGTVAGISTHPRAISFQPQGDPPPARIPFSPIEDDDDWDLLRTAWGSGKTITLTVESEPPPSHIVRVAG